MIMNNEPVAWVQTRAELNNEGAVIAKYTAVKFNSGFEDLPNETPLYTHPAKTLTDEEIKSIWSKIVCSVHMTKAELDFARAILKKAQEK